MSCQESPFASIASMPRMPALNCAFPAVAPMSGASKRLMARLNNLTGRAAQEILGTSSVLEMADVGLVALAGERLAWKRRCASMRTTAPA